MALQFTPNKQSAGNLSFAANQRGRLSVLPAVDWANIQNIPAIHGTLENISKADGTFYVGDGSTIVAETGATARASLGVAIGTDVQAFDADLSALAANSTDGFWAHTGAGTGAARTLSAPAAGLTITNPAGIAGNPTFALANDLAALEALSTTGIVARTASETYVPRTITGTSNKISVTDGSGVSGNPTLNVGGDILDRTAAATLTVGYKATPFPAGTKSSGTYTPLYSDGNFQTATNGGAHTLAPPADDCTIIIQYTNNGSAGAITTSGFTRVTGAFTTTNGDDFFAYITKIGSFSSLDIKALQ